MYFGKSFKKLFALLIAMLMMVGMLPLSTLAEDFDDIGDDTAVIGELQDGEAGFTDSEEPQIGAGDAEAEDAEEGEAGAGEAGSGDAEEGEAGAGDDDSSYIDGVAGISAFEEESEEAIDGAVLGLAGDTAVGDAAIDIMFAAARGVIGNATVTFYVDGNIYETIELDSESGDDWLPEDPVKPGLDFGGWYESGSTTPFDFDDDISGSLILYAKFFATVKFWVDGMQYGETQTVPEGYPVDSVQAPEKEGYTFVEWRTYQHGVFNLSELVNEHLDITARFTKDDTGEEDLYKDYWLAGPGGSVRNFVCPECGFSSGNQYTTGVRLYFYPLPLEEGIARQFALIVITCERCGVISEWQNTSNKGASLSGDGAAPSSTNNINMGEAVLVATYVTITYLPGSDGLVEHNGPGVVKKDEPWEAGWEPGVTPNQGYTFLGWKDQDGVMYGKGSSPPTSDKNYTFTAQYSNLPIVTITAKTTAKLYDGTALTGQDTGYTVSGLYYGDTVSSVDIDGSITNAGSVSSTVDVNSLVIKNASGVDVTDSYLVVTNNGTLTVMKRHLTLTSATDDKAYDGTPLTNGTVMVTGDGFVADEGATYDVTGTITDPGSVPNKFTYELDGNTIAGNYDITKAYGTLTITKSTAEIAITVKDNGKKYDGTALAPVESTVDGLPSGYTLTVAGYTGSIVNVSDSGAGLGGISGYTITRDSDGADATGFFEKATVNKGALTVMKRSAVLTSGDGSKVYDGTPLTNGTVLVSDEGFATGEGATYNVTGTITYPGTADNRFSYTLNGNTLESNYEITKVEGKLTVNANAAVITITAASDGKVYDGTALTKDGFTTSELPAGVTRVDAVVVGSQTGVGSSSNVVESYKLYDADGFDVTAYFAPAVKIPGTLAVAARLLTITAASATKGYDGTALVDGGYEITDGTLAEGQTLDSATVTGSQLYVGSSANVASDAAISDVAGTNVTSNYDISYVDGALEVTGSGAGAITITADSDSKTYDGTALTKDGFTTSDLPAGVTRVDAVVQGSQTGVGSSSNVVESYKLYDADGFDVTAYFAPAVKMPGALVVAARPLTITAASATKGYDGMALVDGGYEITDGTLAEGQTLDSATVTGSQLYVGSSANVASDAAITDAAGANVTSNYDITYSPGTLVVTYNAFTITIFAASDNKTYDGTALTKDGYTTTALPAGVVRVDAVVQGSQTGVGSSSNVVESYKLYDADGIDVTAYFAPAVRMPGTLAVAARPLTITAASATKGYDGTALVDGGYEITNGTLAEGQTLDSATVTGSQLYVGSSANVASDAAITDAAGANVTSNYDISYVDGVLEVTGSGAGAITITADSDSKTYDGTALTKDGFTTSDLPAGVTDVTAVVQGSQTGVGSSANVVESYKLYDADGIDVTAYFAPAVKIPGTLAVAARLLTITAASATKGYDGMALVDGGYEITDGTLAEGQTLDSATVTGSQLYVGSSANVASDAAITDAAGANVTSNYDISYVDGVLEVTGSGAGAITITADSDSKTYDGTALTKDGFTTSDLPAGVTDVTAVVQGSQTGVGSSANVVESYKLYDADGIDVTAYFAPAVKIPGTLAVAARLLTITAASATKGYDGTALVDGGYEITGGTLAEGQTLDDVAVAGSIINPGIVPNIASNAIILDSEYTNVTANYLITYENGELRITTSAAEISITVHDNEKIYDGEALTPVGSHVEGLPGGYTLTVGGYTGSIVNVSESAEGLGGINGYTIIRDADGLDVTAFFEDALVKNGALVITPKAATITVNDSSKWVGQADPAFDGSVEGLIGEDSIGEVIYHRTNDDVNAAGIYTGVLSANYEENGNYIVTIVPGSFEIRRPAPYTRPPVDPPQTETVVDIPTITPPLDDMPQIVPPQEPEIIVNVEPPEVPLSDIPMVEVPLADIPDVDEPIVNLPQTGVATGSFWMVGLGLSAIGFGIIIGARRKEEDEVK